MKFKKELKHTIGEKDQALKLAVSVEAHDNQTDETIKKAIEGWADRIVQTSILGHSTLVFYHNDAQYNVTILEDKKATKLEEKK